MVEETKRELSGTRERDSKLMCMRSSFSNIAEDSFVSLRLKYGSYCGKQAISIYIRDRSQKVKEKLHRMKE